MVGLFRFVLGKYLAETRAPQGSISSPLPFLIWMMDLYQQVNPDIGKSLSADVGAIWKRGRDRLKLLN